MLIFQDTEAFFGLPVNVQFGTEIAPGFKLLSTTISNLVPIVKKLQENRDLLPIKKLSSIKYDLITLQKYLEVYKEFIFKLSSLINNISASPGPLAVINEINSDLKSLHDFSVNFRKSLENIDSLTSVSLKPLLRDGQADFTKALKSILAIVSELMDKTPLQASDIDSKLTIPITYFIRDFVASSIKIYSNMDKPLNFLLYHFTSLVALHTSLKSSVNNFNEDLQSWDRKNSMGIKSYQEQYIKIMNEDLKSIKSRIIKMQEEVIQIKDSSGTLNPASFIDDFEKFSLNHQSRIISANSSITWTLNNFADFSRFAINYWNGTEQETVRTTLETLALRIFSKFPLTVNCSEIFKADLANILKLSSGDLLGCYSDLLLALPWSFQQFTLEYNLMKGKLEEFLNYGTFAGKYIDAATSKSAKILFAKFTQTVRQFYKIL